MRLSQEYEGSICELRTKRNEMIAAGTITNITDEYIEVVARGGAMSLVPYGVDVKINVFNMRKGFRVVAGKVYISTADFVRISDIISLLDYERRHFFRVNTNVPAQLGNFSEQEEGVAYIEAKVINLSLGGAMVTCDGKFHMGERMLLRFNLGNGAMALHCQINRVGTTERGLPFYGCQFLQLKTHEADALCAFIFQRQREQIRRRNVE